MKVGQLVRLKLGKSSLKGPRKVARILRFMREIEGGVVVSEALDGVFRCWNIKDLEPARKRRETVQVRAMGAD